MKGKHQVWRTTLKQKLAEKDRRIRELEEKCRDIQNMYMTGDTEKKQAERIRELEINYQALDELHTQVAEQLQAERETVARLQAQLKAIQETTSNEVVDMQSRIQQLEAEAKRWETHRP